MLESSLVYKTELLQEKEEQILKQKQDLKLERLKQIKQKERYSKLRQDRQNEQGEFREQITSLLNDLMLHKENLDERPITPLSPYIRTPDYSPRNVTPTRRNISLFIGSSSKTERDITPMSARSSLRNSISHSQSDSIFNNLESLQEQLKSLEALKLQNPSSDKYDVRINHLKTQVSNVRSKNAILESNSNSHVIKSRITSIEKYSNIKDLSQVLKKSHMATLLDSPSHSNMSFESKISSSHFNNSRTISPFNLDTSFDDPFSDPMKSKLETNYTTPQKESDPKSQVNKPGWKGKGWIAVPNVETLIPKPAKNPTKLEEKQNQLDKEIDNYRKTILMLKNKGHQLEIEARDLKKKLKDHEDRKSVV